MLSSAKWLCVAALLTSALWAQPMLYQDTNAPLDKRVDDLLSRMTLEEKASQLMNDSPAIERLGIPAYNWWNESLHGVARAGRATVFPQAIGLELVALAVVFPAIELQHQLHLRPHPIHEFAGHVGVRDRQRQLGLLEKLQQFPLVFRTGVAR